MAQDCGVPLNVPMWPATVYWPRTLSRTPLDPCRRWGVQGWPAHGWCGLPEKMLYGTIQ